MILSERDAVYHLTSEPRKYGYNGDGLVWQDTENDPPTQEQIDAKLEELRAAEPMRLLREERDRRISETDWWAGQDLTMTQEQKDYRQALRDLPQNFSPIIDIITEDGYPIVKEQTDWPEKPS